MSGARRRTIDLENMTAQFARKIKSKRVLIENIIGEEDAEKILKSLETLASKVEEERKKIPHGHLYDGVYFQKSTLYEIKDGAERYIKRTGKLYLRDDLISWMKPDSYKHYRNIFFSEDESDVLTKLHAIPVFSHPENFYL